MISNQSDRPYTNFLSCLNIMYFLIYILSYFVTYFLSRRAKTVSIVYIFANGNKQNQIKSNDDLPIVTSFRICSAFRKSGRLLLNSLVFSIKA